MKKTELSSMETKLPASVAGDEIVLAIVLDKKNKMERVLIGTEWNVRIRLEGNRDVPVLFDRERPLGSLILDHDSQDRGWWCAEVFIPFRDALLSQGGRKKKESADWQGLEAQLTSENAVSVFVAGRTLAHYCPDKKELCREQHAEALERNMLILTRSFKERLLREDNFKLEKIMEKIGLLLHFTMMRAETDLHIWYPWKNCAQECVVVQNSLLPLLMYYLRRLDDWGLCFRVCEVCGKYFVAESGHYCLCSAACEKIQNRLNKRAFDERNKDNKPEQVYQQKRDRIRKLLNELESRENTSEGQVENAEKQYKVFRDEAKRKKKTLGDKETQFAFINWLYDQERKFEELYGGK